MNQIKTEDLRIIQNIINGDKDSEVLLYNKYRKIIKNFIYRYYPNNHDIDDDTSDIIIKIFENLHKYDSNITQLNTWILTITKNHMLDKIKKNKPIYTTFNYSEEFSTSANDYVRSNTYFFSEPQHNITPYNQIEISDSLSHISKYISSNDFDMLKMKYSDGYNYNEISKEFNITSSTVSNRINYVKSKLKKIEY